MSSAALWTNFIIGSSCSLLERKVAHLGSRDRRWLRGGHPFAAETEHPEKSASLISIPPANLFVASHPHHNSFTANCIWRDEPDSPVGKRVEVTRLKFGLPTRLPGWPKLVWLNRSKTSVRN